MIELIYRIRSGILTCKWEFTDTIKILVETNNYFTEKVWTTIFNKNMNSNQLEIKYYSNKYEGYKLVKDANVLFTFGDNYYFDKSNLRMLYYGVSQPDLFNDSVTNTYYAKGFSSQSIAEYCLAYSLIIINGFNKYFSNQEQKLWKQYEISSANTTSITDKVIGVFGLGHNGRKVSELFKKMGCKVYGYDIIQDNIPNVDVLCNSFIELLKVSDILIATVNLNSETKYIFNLDNLSLMKKNAYLINVSRGDIINEDDLYKVLKGNKIAGAVLDVNTDETLSRYNKLWSLNNLIITPHISGNINKCVLEVMNDFITKLNQLI